MKQYLELLEDVSCLTELELGLARYGRMYRVDLSVF